MANASVKFDQRGLKALEPREKTFSVSDPKTPGLTLRVTPNGSKTYYYVYRMGGREAAKQWVKVAAFEDLPLNRAQEQARAYRSQVDAGTNPAEVLKTKVAVGTTVEDLVVRFKRDYLPRLAPKTQEGYEDSIDKHILPALGKIPLLDLERSRVITWHGKIEGPRAANLALAVLSCMLTQAMLWGLRPEGINPCAHVQRNPEVPRARDIREDELVAIGKALRQLEGKHTVWSLAAIKVIALCWGRESEVLGLRRDKDCFLDEGYAIIRTHKTSRKQGAKHLVLVPQVVEILKGLPEQADNPHFFVGTQTDGAPLSRHTLYKTWRAVCEEAKVSDLHIHDFRSLAASEGEEQGVPIKTMAHLLGHSDTRTTMHHYTKVRTNRASEVACQVATPIARALDGVEVRQEEGTAAPEANGLSTSPTA